MSVITVIRKHYRWQSNDASPEFDFDPADGAPPLAVATLQNSGSAPSPDAPPPLPLVAPQVGTSASAAASGTNTYTATFSYNTEFSEVFFPLGSSQGIPLLWLPSVSGQISISGGVNQATSWDCTITYSGTPESAPNSDPNYVFFSSTGSQVDGTKIFFWSTEVGTTPPLVTNDSDGRMGVVGFDGTPSSTQIAGTITISDPHWATQIQIPVTLTLGPPPPSQLFTTGNDTVDFTGLTSAQVQAINADAQLYNAMGGSDTVVLPTSFDGISYPLFPLFGAPAIASGIMWDP
jgi:hypothetical protein